MYDLNELGDEGEENQDGVLARKYEQALMHRDKLIEYDVNAARRLGVIDEKQDWYEGRQDTLDGLLLTPGHTRHH